MTVFGRVQRFAAVIAGLDRPEGAGAFGARFFAMIVLF
jgi:hypothetical protein